jgi:large subunit ribosomal protein L11
MSPVLGAAGLRWEVGIVMAKKKIAKQFKIMAPGGKATPAPPLGPALGANGINPGQFIQQFNERTRELNGKVVGCIITLYADRSFEFEIKSSPAAVMIKDAAKAEKGSGKPNTEKVGKITRAQLEAIAKEKMVDLSATSLEAAMKTIAGTARSMGVTVEA